MAVLGCVLLLAVLVFLSALCAAGLLWSVSVAAALLVEAGAALSVPCLNPALFASACTRIAKCLM